MTERESWFAVKTRPNQEDKAHFHLTRQGFAVYLPKSARIVRHARRTLRTARPLFPGYLFVGVDRLIRGLAPVRSTLGVHSLVAMGDAPIEVPARVIDEIREREAEDGLVRIAAADRFKPGDRVSVIDGPLLGHTGIFECVDPKDRITILIDFLGRQVRTTLAPAALA